MSNVKQISIQGQLPFDCDQHYEMRQMLGQLNAPLIGLRMNWLGPVRQFSEIIAFKIIGNEAVSNQWIDRLLLVIVKAGGDISEVSVRDTDNQTDIPFEIPTSPVDKDRLEFICPVMFTVHDSGEAFELHQLQKWLEDAIYVDLRTEDCGNFDAGGEDTCVSMGVMLSQLNHA